MSKKLLHKDRLQQRGVALVELAILLPVLLFMMLAIAELGRGFYQYISLNKQVRLGVRYLAANARVGTTQILQISDAVRLATGNLVVYGNVQGTGTTNLPSLSIQDVSLSISSSNIVAVSVRYAYQPITGLKLPTFGSRDGISLAWNLVAENHGVAL
jgi:hypothetical protein